MTLAEALGAHASAQIAAARAADEARRTATEVEPEGLPEEPRSFVDSWDVRCTVIGMVQAN